MAVRIPLDTIHQLQISLREAANIPSYDPAGALLPALPPLEDSISQVDPSPPYLRCKHCRGRLIRGIKSLFCVFCGKEQFGAVPPDPINFRSTTGYRWLLDSLQLDESEVVELTSEATDMNRGQSAPRNEMALSDLLDLEISWHAEIEKPENAATKDPPRAESSLNLAAVDLDNFFSEGKEEAGLDKPEGRSSSKDTNQASESNAFQSVEDLSLFENAQPSTTTMSSKEHESDNSQPSWATEFQSAGSGSANKDSRSLDPFAGSQADISQHIDTIFGPGSTDPGNTLPSSDSNADDWFQQNPRSNSSFPTSFMDPTNSSSANTDDWFQDNQWQGGGSKPFNQSKTVDENDNSLDAWDDFTSSTGQKAHPDSSFQEEPDLFSQVSGARETEFGAFQQPDLFSGALNSRSGPENVNQVHLEASALDRTLNTDMKSGTEAAAAKGEDTTNATSSETDVDTIVSQMHDLSFMLDSNLSIPQTPSAAKE